MNEAIKTVEGTTRKVAVVTGAGSGIGRAVALALLAAGWQVALAGRRREPLAEVAAHADGSRTLVVPTDVSDAQAVRALFEQVVAGFGRVDFLFNNAGIFPAGGPWEEMTAEQWRAVVEVNMTGMFFCAQQAFRTMKAQAPQGGRILNNGSIAAHAPRPNSIAYTATKHAVTGMTKSIALDGRRHGIACGQIDIGNAATQMADRFEQGILQANGEVASEPLMDADIVAQAIVHMAEMPLSANVLFQTILATGMPFVGRG